MTFGLFLPDSINSAGAWIGLAMAGFAEAAARGPMLGLVILLLAAVAVAVAVWWVLYRTLLVWLQIRQEPGSRRR